MQFVAAWRVFVKEKANKKVRLLTRYNSRTEQYPSDSDNEDGEGRRAKPCPDWDAQILDGYDQFPELQAHLEARGQNDKLPRAGIEELVLRVYRPQVAKTPSACPTLRSSARLSLWWQHEHREKSQS